MNKLDIILEDLNSHKRNKEEILREAIENRLNKSLQTYYEELTKTVESLYGEDCEKVLRSMGD